MENNNSELENDPRCFSSGRSWSVEAVTRWRWHVPLQLLDGAKIFRTLARAGVELTSEEENEERVATRTKKEKLLFPPTAPPNTACHPDMGC